MATHLDTDKEKTIQLTTLMKAYNDSETYPLLSQTFLDFRKAIEKEYALKGYKNFGEHNLRNAVVQRAPGSDEYHIEIGFMFRYSSRSEKYQPKPDIVVNVDQFNSIISREFEKFKAGQKSDVTGNLLLKVSPTASQEKDQKASSEEGKSDNDKSSQFKP